MPTSSAVPSFELTDDASTKIMRPKEILSESQSYDPVSAAPRIYGYEILSIIGSGGMGIVYKAHHRILKRTVALKLLRGAALTDPDYRERFRAEAEAVARLQHPNIIQVFEVGVSELLAGENFTSPFIALEFVDGGSLTQKTDKPQSPRFAAEMVEKLARAVHSAHQQGVIHRDLKPANVLLTREGDPKIADFGIAKQVGSENACRSVTQVGTVMGTPEYMAPEQSAGDMASPATDVYGLGVILYELLTARLPFHGATPIETMTFAQQHDPVSPRRFRPDLSRDLETICLKCLEKDPASRYQTAEALANDLRCYLDGRTIQARRASELERTARWCKRNPLVTASLLAILATVLIAFVAVSRSYLQAEQAWQNESEQRREAERKEKAERWERYRANISATASSLELYDTGGAMRNLQASPAEHRNWEWRHFQTRIDLSHAALSTGESSQMTKVVCADGSRMFLFGNDRTVRIWRTSDLQLLRTIPGRPWVDHTEISSDGEWLAYPDGSDIIVRNTEVEDPAPTVLRGLATQVSMAAFNIDGSRVVAADDRTACVWDRSSGRLIFRLSPFSSGLRAVRMCPRGQRIIIEDSKTNVVELRAVDSGELIGKLEGAERELERATFNEQSTRLLTHTRFPDNKLKLWNAETGQWIADLKGHENSLKKIVFSRDGGRVATCSLDQTVRLWDGLTGQPVALLNGHKGWVNSAVFSPDGKRLVTASQDHTLRLWDGGTGAAMNVLFGHTMEVSFVHYTPDGERLFSVSRDGTARVWEARKLDGDGVLRGHTKFVYGVAYHPDGRRAASAAWDGTVRIWDTVAEKQLQTFDHGKRAIVTSVAIHPQGKVLASRSIEAVHLWDLETGRELHRWETPSDRWRHTRLAFSPKGDLLAAGGADNTLHLWDVESREEIARFKGHTDVIRDVTFSPDGQFLASVGETYDRCVRVWDIAQKKQVQVLEGHNDCVYCLGFSKDGKLLASGSVDGTVRLWDTAQWKETAVLKHGTNVYSLAFTPDGSRLACGCANNSIRLWDLATRQEVVDLRGHTAYVHSISFSPDGNRLVSGSGDYTLRVWDTNRK